MIAEKYGDAGVWEMFEKISAARLQAMFGIKAH